MNSDFFEINNYFVDNISSLRKKYHIYNNKRERIGSIKQDLTFRQKILKLIPCKTLFPFLIEIRNANGGLESSIAKRSFSFVSDITLYDALGKKIGTIYRRNFFTPEFKVLNASNEVIAEIRDAWHGPNFVVYDTTERQIGSIDKKWTGRMKNFVKSNRSYNVSMSTNYSENENRIAILTSAIAINMLFFN
ncbi:Scramblase [compost metagenome]|jgi:uncharacterized protein YxjI